MSLAHHRLRAALPDGPFRQTLPQLAHGQALFILGLRVAIRSQLPPTAVPVPLAHVFEQDAATVNIALRRFALILGIGARRKFTVGPPCAIGITADEHSIVGLLNAINTGDRSRTKAHLEWLATPAHHAAIIDAGAEVTDLFACRGVTFDAR